MSSLESLERSDLKPAIIAKTDLFGRLPDPWQVDLRPRIRKLLAGDRRKVVVLDDDPTGTQTVHRVPVLTQWSLAGLASEFEASGPTFYLLTNSRALTRESACLLNQRIGRDLVTAGQKTGRGFVVISRSDSTLRGHFPAEVDALAGALSDRLDALIIIPYFEEGERYTVGDVHYLAKDRMLVPVGMSEYAQDATFGYHASNLRDWVAEKMSGRISAQEVASISIETLRLGGPEAVADTLMAFQNGRICIVNAASYRDLEVFTAGLLAAESRGKRFLYRSAASFVQVRSGISPRPLLSVSELQPAGTGGLVVVGSHVPTTTTQLDHLLANSEITPLKIDAARLIEKGNADHEISRACIEAQRALSSGKNVVLFTSRRVIGATDPETSLQISRQIANGITAVVRGITARPRFVITKGGITSSDVATSGLGVKRAVVRGQILPGVPVWQLGSESRFAEMIYVVFPGNVGSPSALTDVFKKLKIN